MAASMRTSRLQIERKNWQKNKPFNFSARPKKQGDGTVDLGTWNATIPGPKGTPWEDGFYGVTLVFPADYPRKPPHVRFTPPIFHPNVYADGEVGPSAALCTKFYYVFSGTCSNMWRFSNCRRFLIVLRLSPTHVQVCLTLVNAHKWAIGTTVSEILLGLQTFLAEPNYDDPANSQAGSMAKNRPDAYAARVRAYARKTMEQHAAARASKKASRKNKNTGGVGGGGGAAGGGAGTGAT